MRKKWVFLLLLAIGSGCATAKPKVLSREAFLKHFNQAQPAAATTNAADAATKPRLITPGTQLTVSVAEDRSLNRQIVVPPSGVVEFAGVGRLSVTGLTTDELAQKIREPLERDFFKKATVEVMIESTPTLPTTVAAGTITVMGSVGRPGPMLLPAGQTEPFTVLKAVLAAGGLGQFADGANVRLLRYDSKGQKIETRVNVTRIMKLGEYERDVPLQDGDWVVVPEKWVSF
jgi:polysaccharide export outer membrane protein